VLAQTELPILEPCFIIQMVLYSLKKKKKHQDCFTYKNKDILITWPEEFLFKSYSFVVSKKDCTQTGAFRKCRSLVASIILLLGGDGNV
jgi:hypothetical protein